MKRNSERCMALVLALMMILSLFPVGAFAEGDGSLPVHFICDETTAYVTVYDAGGQPVDVGADGVHHLTPGTYSYSATADGYESTGMQTFLVPEGAVGDQELRLFLTPVKGGEQPAAAPEQDPQNETESSPTPQIEDDGKLRIYPADGSFHLTIDGEYTTAAAVPAELQEAVGGKDKEAAKPGAENADTPAPGLYLKQPAAEELYLDRLAVEKAIGYFTTDWTVVNLVDEEGERKAMTGSYDVIVSGPAMDKYASARPVFALLTLHWDEEGKIVDRDVSIIETNATPGGSSWSFRTDTLSTLVIATPTGNPYVEENAKDETKQPEESPAPETEQPAETPKEKREQVTLTYRATKGGVLSAEQEIVDVTRDYISVIGVFANPDFGYHFRDWTDEDGNVVSESLSLIPEVDAYTEDHTYTANFLNPDGVVEEDPVYTVNFLADDEVVETRVVKEGEALGELPAAPEKEGFAFLEWRNGESAVSAETTVNEELQLTAFYEEIETPEDAEGAEPAAEDKEVPEADAEKPDAEKPDAEKPDDDLAFTSLEYTFSGDAAVSLAGIFSEKNILIQLKNYDVKTEDTALIDLTKESRSFLFISEEDYVVAPVGYFDTAVVTVESNSDQEDSYRILLHHAAPTEPVTVTLTAEQVNVGYADVSDAAAALGLANTEAVPVLPKRNLLKTLLKRADTTERFTRSGYVGLEISVDEAALTENGEYIVPVTLPDAIAVTGVENAVIDRLEVQVYHVVDGEAVPVEATCTEENGLLTALTIRTDGFSPYIVSYTVEFHNGENEVVIDGGTQVLLSTLITELGLTRPDGGSFTVDDVAAVEFKTPELFQVEEVTGETAGDSFAVVLNAGTEQEQSVEITTKHDFVLTSTQPFTADQMILTFTDGTSTEVPVTDVQESSDLTNFLTNAVITGATQNADGKYEVEQGKDYSIILSFAENSNYQFDNDADLTYDMPDGITVITKQTGSFQVNIVYKGRTYQVDASYTLDTNGHLTIKFDENDPDYHHLAESTNVSFRFSYHAMFDGSGTEIRFNDEVERDIVFDEPEPAQAYASKTATFDESTGTFHYTIKVTATGDVTNVNVKDVISGNALIFNNDVAVTGIDSYTDNHASSGFDYTFASMGKDDVITITYSAKADFSKDSDKDGKLTVDQTKNTVTVQPDGGDPHNSEYSHEITFKSTKKSDGTEAGTTEDGDKIIDWSIDYNRLALASAAGDKITDTIGVSSRDYMKYYGEGITVKVYDHDGNPVATRNVSYAELTAHSDSSWTYTIPDTDTTPYRYVITYQTVVDMAKVTASGKAVHLDNTANGDGGGYDAVPGDVTTISKRVSDQVVNQTEQYVKWESVIHVPEGGLSEAVVTDTVPTMWLGHITGENRSIYEQYIADSLQITGLLDGESYDLNTSNQEKVVITFYKDSGKTQRGLQAASGGHDITVKLKTEVNPVWLQHNYENPTNNSTREHKNTIDINGTSATAVAQFSKTSVRKVGPNGTNGIRNYSPGGGATYRFLRYELWFTGVKEEPLTVSDEFDTGLLKVADPALTAGDKANLYEHMRIYGGDYPNQAYEPQNGIPVQYSETADGLTITANTVPKNSSGNYYYNYKIVYYLQLKDGVDLEQLAIANGGEYDLINKATWGDHVSEFTYTTEYDYLNKELLNAGELGGTSRNAQYRITFNAAKATLNDGEPMTMTDTLSANLSVDYSSIQITTDPAGASVPYSLSGGPEGSTIATYTVPDSTKVVITYNAEVRGNGSQKIINKVSVNGKDETIEDTKDYGSASEGEGAKASFKIVKVDGNDANKKLSGVRFKIFCEDKTVDFGQKAGHAKEIFLTTDENGEIVLDGGDYDFYFGKCYHVQEVEAPEDYGTISFDYLVTLTNEMAQVDYGHYVYYFSDSMQIKNWPLEGLIVEKQVESTEEADHDRYYNFQISILKDDGSVDTSYNEKNGDDQFTQGRCEFTLKAGEQKMFWGFDKGTKYKVEEIFTDGAGNEFTTTVSYDVFDEDGNVTEHKEEAGTSHSGTLTQEDEVIVFKNSKEQQTGGLKITKIVTENGSTTLSDAAKSKLAGNYEFKLYTDEACTTAYQKDGADVTVSISIPETGEAVTSDEITGLPAGDYWVKETEPTNGSTPETNPVKVTVEAGKTGEQAVIAEFTNNYETVKAKVTKIWAGGGTTPESLTVTLSNGETVTLNAGNNWTATVENLPRYGSDGTEIEYTWTEASLPAGYYLSNTTTTTSEDAATGVITHSTTLTNTKSDSYNPTTSIKGKKVWQDSGTERPDSITVNLYQGEGDNKRLVTSITVQAPSGDSANPDEWPFEFTNLPVFNPDGSIIQYSVEEVLPEGYTSIYGVKVEFEQATYIPGTPTGQIVNSGQGSQTFDVSEGVNLGYIVIRHGNDFIIWTPRPATSTEIADIKTKVVGLSDQFNGITNASGNALKIESGVPMTVDVGKKHAVSVYMDGTTVKMTFLNPNAWSDFAYGTIPYTYTPAGGEGGGTITNTDQNAYVNPSVTKVFTGRNWTDTDSFEFTLAADPNNSEGATLPTTLTKTATKDEQTVTFDKIKFTKEGTYTFTITETEGTLPGVTYDTEPKAITVNVSKGTDGKLSAVCDPTDATVTAENTYEASGKGEVKVQKVLEGREWTDNDEFTFTITAAEGTPMPGTTSITITKSDADQTKSFGEISFTKEGTYTYTVKETKGSEGGITYDETEHTVTIRVVDDGNGNLVAAEGSSLIQTEKITNTYAASGKGEVKVQKVLEGREWTDNDEFTFTITAAEGTPMPGTTSITITKSDADQTKSFGEISFTKEGTYTYTVKETKGSEGGITYDETEHTVTIRVVDDGNGNLVAAEGSSLIQTAEFTNTYAAEGKATLEATKAISGAAWPEGKTVTFTVSGADGAPMPETTTVTLTKPGTASFEEIKYVLKDAGKTYTYTIKETADFGEGWIVSPEKITATVKVTDNGDGTLKTEVTYDPADKTITNTRETGDLKLSKKLVSDLAADAEQEFTFTVKLDDTTISGTYGDMTFDAGKATVKLKGGESKKAEGLPTGITYTITEATARGFDADKTEETGTISKDTTAEAVFTNTRQTGDLELSKKLVSDLAADKSVEFTFTVTLGDDTISGTYGDMTFDAGKATVMLKGGESKKATGLPTTLSYTITEADADGFELTGKTGDTGAISKDGAKAEFTNTRDTGDLKVTKTLKSDLAADQKAVFDFTVTLADTTISGTYGGMTFTEGVATFSLKGGESKSATNLPTTLDFTVEEKPADGFDTEFPKDNSGTINKEEPAAIEIVNTRQTGDLEVTKTVDSALTADKDMEFQFTVTLEDKTISGTYGEMEFTGGVATFPLKDGETKKAEGLPTTLSYTVAETTADGFTTEYSGETGAISKDAPASVSVTNTRIVSTLRITKRVSGTGASTKTQFPFTVYLRTGHGTLLEGQFPVKIYDKDGNVIGDAAVNNGMGTFKLAHGQYAVVYEIPVTAKWEVAETDAKGYSSSAETAKTGVIGEKENVSAWENHRSSEAPIPKTGYGDGTATAVGLFSSLGVFLASAIGTILQGRSMKKKKRGDSHVEE